MVFEILDWLLNNGTWFTVYAVVFLIGLVTIFVSAALGGLSDVSLGDGGLHEGVGDDATSLGTEQVGLSPISPLLLAILATMFGLGGMLSTLFLPDMHQFFTMLLALALGFSTHAAFYHLMKKVFVNTQANSVHRAESAAGEVGVVRVRITPDAPGAIDYTANGQTVHTSARGADTFEPGEPVRIKQVVGGIAFVERP